MKYQKKSRTLIDIVTLKGDLTRLIDELKKLLVLKETYIVFGYDTQANGSTMLVGYKFNKAGFFKGSARSSSRTQLIRQLYFVDRVTAVDLDVKLLQLRINNIKEQLGVK